MSASEAAAIVNISSSGGKGPVPGPLVHYGAAKAALNAYTATLAHNFADAHHLHHLARTILVVGANVAAFGVLWVLKFLILNRLFAQIAEAEVGAET